MSSFRDEARYLPCLRCGDRMVRRAFGQGSGVIVDLCRDHGVWLDRGELERIVEWVRAGGSVRPPASPPPRPRPVPSTLAQRAARPRWRRTLSFIGDVLDSMLGR